LIRFLAANATDSDPQATGRPGMSDCPTTSLALPVADRVGSEVADGDGEELFVRQPAAGRADGLVADVQGYEDAVLAGAARCVATCAC